MPTDGTTRRSVLGGVGAGVAGALAGCLGGGNGDGGGELHILTDLSGDQWEPYWEEELIPSWEEQSDVPINLEFAGFEGTGEQRLAALMQAGDPPEFYHATTAELGELINQGMTLDVTDVVEDLQSQWGDALFDHTLQPLVGDRDDEFHSIPHGVYIGGCLNYRADVYEDLGLEVPETWDELRENARAIDEAGGEWEEMRGWALPGAPAGKSGSDFSNWLYNSGGLVWEEGGGNEVELAFDEQYVLPVLEMLQDMAEYSPDPSAVDWGTTIEYWIAGRMGQCFMNNAWLCGPAYFAGAEEVALNTEQALIPLRNDDVDPHTRGWILVNGTPIIDGSSNPDEAREFKRYMYGPERHVEVSLMEPMRFLPPYEEIMETDAYQSADVFQLEDGEFLRKNQHVMDEIVPELDVEIPSTPASNHVSAFNIPEEMTNRVVVEGEDPEDAYEWAYEQYERRIEETRQQSNWE